jgi:hypothetical protein
MARWVLSGFDPRQLCEHAEVDGGTFADDERSLAPLCLCLSGSLLKSRSAVFPNRLAFDVAQTHLVDDYAVYVTVTWRNAPSASPQALDP